MPQVKPTIYFLTSREAPSLLPPPSLPPSLPAASVTPSPVEGTAFSVFFFFFLTFGLFGLPSGTSPNMSSVFPKSCSSVGPLFAFFFFFTDLALGFFLAAESLVAVSADVVEEVGGACYDERGRGIGGALVARVIQHTLTQHMPTNAATKK